MHFLPDKNYDPQGWNECILSHDRLFYIMSMVTSVGYGSLLQFIESCDELFAEILHPVFLN